jgi:hypothetical protein
VAEVAPLPPVTLAQPVLPSGDCCHWIVPVLPLTLTVVLLPLHTVEAVAVAVPPTEVGLTVTATDAHVEVSLHGAGST